jgi:myosin-5
LEAKEQAELTAKTQAERDAKEHAEALEAERVRAEQREESERIETEKATEAERIAAVEKAAEAESIAADEKAAEAERIAADEKAAEAAKQEALAAAKARAEQASSVEALERKVCAESSARVAAETDAEACRVALVEARAAQKRAETELVCFKQHSVLRSVADTEINAAVANAEARVVTNCPVTETIMSSPDELLVTSHKDIARLEAENGTLRASLADTTNRASSYQHKLFQAELEWSGEMAALQAALAAVRQALESGVPPDSKIVDSNTLGNENKLTPGRQLNGCSMETEKLSPGTPSEERERRQRSLQKQKRKAEANAVQLANVNALHDEFDSTRRVFEDDTEFIVEVREGISDAAIDPHVELKRLGQRFQEWKVDFKEKIRETRAALRRADEFECDARADSAAAELEIRNAFNEKQHRWGDDDSRPDDDDGWIDAVEDSLGRVSAPEKEKKRKGWGLKRALGLKR